MTDETIRQPSPFSDAGEATVKPVPVIPRDAKGRRVSQASPATVADAPPAPVDADDPYAEKRRTRVKVGTVKRKLYAPQREGFQRRFVNDLPGRVEDMKERGWDIVMKDGRPWTVSASQSEKLIAYLMEIPDEFYIEDDVSKQEKLDETDFAIYRGRLNEEPGDNRYVPRSTPIKMSVQRGTGKS